MANQRTNRNIKLVVWLTSEEERLLTQAIHETGQSKSSYIRAAMMRAIKADLVNQGTTKVN